MKTIRIALLILIIIGIVLIITQRIWVPKLVDKILSNENVQIVTPTTQTALILKDGRQCYTYNHEATKTEPYTVNEFLDITISGMNIAGKKTGNQKGPDMTNGYAGTIIGSVNKNMVTDIFSYVVEGSANKEEEIYRTNNTGIEKLRYPLIEGKGILVPDTTKEYTIMQYARVECTASN